VWPIVEMEVVEGRSNLGGGALGGPAGFLQHWKWQGGVPRCCWWMWSEPDGSILE
jgi:hypothetical protein